MTLERTTTIEPGLVRGCKRFKQTIKGWPGSGFERQTAELDVRRVNRDGADELQITLVIRTATEKRTNERVASMTLPQNMADIFVQACAEVA